MKKKNIIFIILYMIILAAPFVSMPFFFNAKNTEKRELASFPNLVTEGKINRDFSKEINEFINDRIGFRNYLVGADTVLMEKVFKRSAVDKVIIGKDGWLFFTETLSDYQRTNPLSDRSIKNLVRTIEMMNDYLKEKDIPFVFTIIPNKNTLYPEYMQSCYKRENPASDMERIAEGLSKTEVNYADVYKALNEKNEVLYQKMDSHWTYEGALYGYECIMDSSGMDYNSFDSISFEKKKDWNSDLAEMLYSEFTPLDYQSYPQYEFEAQIVSREKEPDALLLKTENENGIGKAYIFRDSFMNTQHVYFAENFENATFSRAYPFNFEKIEDDTDLVVLEIVERNLENIISKAPILTSSELNEKEVETLNQNGLIEISDDSFNLFMENKNSLYHLYGFISENCLKDDSRIFIETEGVLYEAFPVYEKELLSEQLEETDDKINDNGFSLYLENEPNSLEEISIYVTN